MDNRYNRHNRRKYSLKVHIVLVSKFETGGAIVFLYNKSIIEIHPNGRIP